MTIANETNKSGPYFYNGAATSFGYGFKIDDATHIRVVETVIATGVETDLVLNTDYTVTGVGNDTGSVVISPARAAGKSVTLVRDVPFTQPIVLENQGAYFAKVVEAALDRGVARDQQLQEQISRAVKVDVSSDVDPDELMSTLISSSAAAVASAASASASAAQTTADRTQTGLDRAAAQASAGIYFNTIGTLLVDTTLSYSGVGAVAAGRVVNAEGFRYQVAASGSVAYNASTQINGYHLATAGGVKLFVLPNDNGTYNANAFGVTADSTTDDTVKLRLAIEFAGGAGLALGKAGTIRVTSSIERFGDLRISNPNGTKIYADTGTYSTQAVIKATGTMAQVQDISVNATKGAVSITGAGTWTFAPGDIGLIYNPTNGSFSAARTYYRAGEFFECRDAPTTVMTLRNPLYAAYVAAAVDVYKITPVTVQIDDIVLEGGSAPLNLLHVTFGKNVAINRPRMKHLYDACIVLDRCFGVTVENPVINNRGAGNPGDYGIVVSNTQHWRIVAPDIYSRRHPITTGGYDILGCVPVRDGKILGGTLRNDQASGATCGDFHGNTQDCDYIGVTIYGGASIGGRDNGIRDCRIRGGVLPGPAILASEVVGGIFTVLNNEMEIFTNPEPNGRGFIDLGGNSVVFDTTVVDDCHFRIRGNTFKSAALSANTNLIYGGNVGTTKKISVEVTGNVFDVNDFASVLRLYRSSGTAASDYLIVDENVCALGGRYSIFGDGDYSALPVLRCQETSWAETVTLSTSASLKLGTAKTFKWRFPRNPAIVPGRIGIGYAGNRIGIPYANPYDGQSATLGIGTDDATNFSSASSVTLTGNAKIREV